MLDGAVLVVSAVEGVQAQTRVLVRALRRQQVPTFVFVNKVDRRGARDHELVQDIGATLGLAPIQMTRVVRLGSRDAAVAAYDDHDAGFTSRLVEVLADRDDAVLTAYLDDPATLTYPRLRSALAAQVRRGDVHPVYLGSAVTGAGVRPLMAGLAAFLPSADGDREAAALGIVFKVERAPTGTRVAYVRMFAGTLRTRDRVQCGARGRRKVTAISVFEPGGRGGVAPRDTLAAGQIGKVGGLDGVRIGDAIGAARDAGSGAGFAPPGLESVVVPRDPTQRAAMHDALTELADQDPLIDVRADPLSDETVVSLYGEVQKEVLAQTLAADFGVHVDFLASATICVERCVAAGTAIEEIPPAGRSAAQPYLAGVGLRVEPAPAGSGSAVTWEIERGSLPRAFRTAIEDAVPAALGVGPHGWQVVDCTVAVVSSGYWPRQSHAHATFDKTMSSTAEDFRRLTRIVLARAVRRAGTVVCEPIHRFDLEIPADSLGFVLPSLAQLRGVPEQPRLLGASYVVEGDIPATQVQPLQERLPGLTRGEGALSSAFDRYEPVRGSGPLRPARSPRPAH